MPTEGPPDDDDPILARSTKSQRMMQYFMVGGQIFTNYVPRLAVPYIVPFMVAEFGFTDLQRASLLSAFTPGYVWTMIPGAPLTAKLGPKRVLALNNMGTCAVLALLPAAASTGAAAVYACFAAMGVAQGLFIAPQAAMTSSWVPRGPERPLGVFIIRLGGNLAKLVAAVLTPAICSTKRGWRAVPVVYGGWTLVYLALFWVLARDSPPALMEHQEEASAPVPQGHSKKREAVFAGHLADHKKEALAKLTAQSNAAASLPAVTAALEEHLAEHKEKLAAARKPEPEPTVVASAAADQTRGGFNVKQLTCRPTIAMLSVQVAHMLCEFNIVLSWAPTYFHEQLGVPLSQLGIFTSLPVIMGIACKSGIAAWESRLLKKGTSQLLVRKIATVYGTAITAASLVIFNATRSSIVASGAYCLIVLGNSFDYSGFLPNFIELAGDDPSGSFYAYVNTIGWGLSWLAAEAINRLATLGAGGSRRWSVVWLMPALSRVLATAIYSRWCSTRPAQEHLDDPGLLERLHRGGEA
jgi:sugar phosphate permease